MIWDRIFDRWLSRLRGHPVCADNMNAQADRRIHDRSARRSVTAKDGQPLVLAQNPSQAGIVRSYVRERCVGAPSVVTAYAVGENELPQIIAGEGASGCFSIGHGIGLSAGAGHRLLTAGSTSALFRDSDAPVTCAEAGRGGYIVRHDRERAKIRDTTIALAEKIGRPDLAERLR